MIECSRVPNAKLVTVNTRLLEAASFHRLTLDLPAVTSRITITPREDITNLFAAAAASRDGITSAAAPETAASSTGASSPIMGSRGVIHTDTAGSLGGLLPQLQQQWVGEVVEAPGPLSVVTFVVAEAGRVHGNIRYYDRRARKIRTFRVSKTIQSRPSM
jgi:hypothetical protein